VHAQVTITIPTHIRAITQPGYWCDGRGTSPASSPELTPSKGTTDVDALIVLVAEAVLLVGALLLSMDEDAQDALAVAVVLLVSTLETEDDGKGEDEGEDEGEDDGV
jgi:hypothetical protein